jgi:hypothetical protein
MIDRKALLGIAAISTLAVAAFAPTVASAVPARFDGTWSVLIMTSRGTCSSGVRFGVEVRDGAVLAAGGVNVKGNVAASGATRVAISAGSQRASGSGRLSGNAGAGTWRGVGDQGVCAGSWTATRR